MEDGWGDNPYPPAPLKGVINGKIFIGRFLNEMNK
jgi:hypothetical protein